MTPNVRLKRGLEAPSRFDVGEQPHPDFQPGRTPRKGHGGLKHEGGHYVVQSRPGGFLWISPNNHTYTVDRDPPR